MRARIPHSVSHPLLLSLLFAAVPMEAGANTFDVPVPVPTIQGAIDLCADGDTVRVASGTYGGPGNFDLRFGGTDLILVGAGMDETIIDCGGQARGLSFDHGETSAAIVEGLTIRNGRPPSGNGGGIYCNNARPTIRTCAIENCSATSGGGIYCFNQANAAILGCRITDNAASSGGGICIAATAGTLIATCRIADNRVLGRGVSGGLYATESTVTVSSCDITGNESFGAAFAGAAVATVQDCDITGNKGYGVAAFSATTQVTIARCSIEENTDFGVYMWGPGHVRDCAISRNVQGVGFFQSAGSMSRCSVLGNQLVGVRLDGGTPMVDSCLIAGNAGVGGIYCRESTPTIAHCTIARNRGYQYTGGIYCEGPAQMSVESSILWGNCTTLRQLYLVGGATIDFECSAVDTSRITGLAGVSYNNCVLEDPLFCDLPDCSSTPTDAGGYAIASGSPCLPENSPCDGKLIGVSAEGCSHTPVRPTTWGRLKRSYR
jgi:hypothetical protein